MAGLALPGPPGDSDVGATDGYSSVVERRMWLEGLIGVVKESKSELLVELEGVR